MKKKAIIVSIKGCKLSNKEKLLLSNEKPWGLILFKRNIKSLKQIQKLTREIRKSAKDSNFPIFIDEEGGKVSRITEIFLNNFNANYFGSLYEKDKKIAISVYKTYSACLILK